MKILVVSNFYPPYYIGGYELRCKDIVDSLCKRGHKVNVITSKHRSVPYEQGKKNTIGIYRELSYSLKYPEKVSLKSTFLRELRDNHAIKHLIRSLKPELIYIFNMEGLSKSLLRSVESSKISVLYDISDYWLSGEGVCDNWLIYWQYSPRSAIKRFIKLKAQALITKKFINKLSKYVLPTDSKSLILKFTYFTSRFLKESYINAGFKVNDAQVIYCGIPTELIKNKSSKLSKPPRLLYVGNIIPNKGTHTLIEALTIMKKRGYETNLTLIGGEEREYFKKLNSTVSSENLKVNFMGRIERNRVFTMYKDYDILIFPSIWDEPFSLTLLEGMSVGLPVISTTTGGSKEILIDGDNCITFESNNSKDLADKIQYLIDNPDICEKIGINASKLVREKFTVQKMIDEVEIYLKSLNKKEQH